MKERTIRRWMQANYRRFVDRCGELNCTAMVEAWDYEQSDGAQTTDPDHAAWTLAVEVAEETGTVGL